LFGGLKIETQKMRWLVWLATIVLSASPDGDDATIGPPVRRLTMTD
jgi:hypothetical protein